ncbi:MAG: hypothetical protein CMM01_18500 [Rhodopirellula sp.]|nr:hypothetical protein [Rhodopirellula sp.]
MSRPRHDQNLKFKLGINRCGSTQDWVTNQFALMNQRNLVAGAFLSFQGPAALLVKSIHNNRIGRIQMVGTGGTSFST